MNVCFSTFLSSNECYNVTKLMSNDAKLSNIVVHAFGQESCKRLGIVLHIEHILFFSLFFGPSHQ